MRTQSFRMGRDVGLAADNDALLSLEDTVAQLTLVRQAQSPRLALKSAIALREDITPRLLAEIALAPVDVEVRYRAEPDLRTAYCLHTLSFHLLGLFGEPRAFPLMLDYFASDCDLAADLSGEALDGHLPSMLVRCYDGSDLRQLRLMIETEAFEPTFRYECLQAYHGLELAGHIDRSEVVTYVEGLLDAIPADAIYGSWYVWLAMAAAALQEPGLRERIDALFDRGLTSIAEGFAPIADKRDIADIYAKSADRIAASILNPSFYEGFVEKVCRWYWFKKPKDPLREPAVRALEALEHDLPYVRFEPKVGRNDPCPCGSGKKYKKCCLH